MSVESLSLLLLNPTTTNSNARKGTAHGATAATHGPASRGTSTAHAQAGPTEPSAGNSEPGVVVDASLQCLVLQARMYPRSLGVAMRVGAAGVSSPQGQLFNTGVITSQQAQEGMGVSLSGSGTGTLGLDPCLLQPLQLNLPGVGAAGSAPTSLDGAPSQAGPSCALALDFTQAPQDNSADAVVQLLVAPSYVTYVPAAFDAISNFFSPPGAASRELVALQARAAAQAEALKQLAALRLRSLSLARDKPKLLVHAVAHAPKIAIPNATSTTVLLLDLGRFVMRSSRWGAHVPVLWGCVVGVCFFVHASCSHRSAPPSESTCPRQLLNHADLEAKDHHLSCMCRLEQLVWSTRLPRPPSCVHVHTDRPSCIIEPTSLAVGMCVPASQGAGRVPA